ncbi:MAG: lyase family protein, partial [Microbacterium sp.]
MPTDAPRARGGEPSRADGVAVDQGLLTPVSAGRDAAASDAAVLRALIEAETALVRAYAAIGAAPASVGKAAAALRGAVVDAGELARAAVAGGNPVIPLVGLLRSAAAEEVRPWVHRGATSQDVLDTALVLVARASADRVIDDLGRVVAALADLAERQRDVVAAGRTLTQHAVPTTIGLRAANWLRGVERASVRLREARDRLPAQFGGAGGTLAATAEILGEAIRDAGAPDAHDDPTGERTAAEGTPLALAYSSGEEAALALRDAYARELGLEPAAPWHTQRWPITELGDALVGALDALGKLAADVATASRTEIAELAEPSGGGSSAMPQKQNPTRSVLIRSAAIRAPQLGATLHLAAALAVDERPDGSWHAEWPALRELLRAALGASSHAADLAEGLRVNRENVARTLAASGGLIVSERLGAVLGKDEAARI